MTTVHRGEVRDNYEMVVKNLEIFGNTIRFKHFQILINSNII